MSPPRIVRSMTDGWGVDPGDGSKPFHLCPCCGKAFTLEAAEVVVDKLARDELAPAALVKMDELRRALARDEEEDEGE